MTRRKREQKFCVANAIVTNNLRMYYLERFNKFYKYNMRRFAKDCDVSYTSMENYLIQGRMPRYQSTLEKIEDRLGKERDDVFVMRGQVEWDVTKHTWAHPDRGSSIVRSDMDISIAAEPIDEYRYTRGHRHRVFTPLSLEQQLELREHLLMTIPLELLCEDEVIRNFMKE